MRVLGRDVVRLALAVALSLLVSTAGSGEPRTQKGTDGCQSWKETCGSSSARTSTSGSSSSGGSIGANYGSTSGNYGVADVSDGSADVALGVATVVAAYALTKVVFGIFDMIFDSSPKPSATRSKVEATNDTGPNLCIDPSQPGCEHLQSQRVRQQVVSSQANVQAEYASRLGRAFASLENPWAVRTGAPSFKPANPWADGQSNSSMGAADLGNPWADSSASAKRATDADCSKAWFELTEQLSALSDKASEIYRTCYSRGTAEGNICANGALPPIYEEMRVLKESREQQMNDCRAWIVTKQYEQTARGAKMAKSLYDKAVGTNGIVRQIQNTALREINKQNVNTLHNIDQVLRGMDQLGNPWAASSQ